MLGMTTADQVLTYLKVLVWPTIVVLALVLFRDPIRKLLGNIEEFEGFGVKAKIRQQVDQATRDAETVLAASPAAKVADRPTRALSTIARNMQSALEFSFSITPRYGSPSS